MFSKLMEALNSVCSAKSTKTKMSLRFLISCFLVTTLWSFVGGTCEVLDRINGCEYTVHCLGNPGSIYISQCNEEPNVTFIVEHTNTRTLSLGFFSRTNFDQRVRYLRAIDNNWHFIEPNTFKYYKKCLSMDLSKNSIVDIENEAFNELVMLKELNLSHNSIEVLKEKSLQLSVTSQNALEVVDLTNNLLTSIGSDVFSNLANLKTLLLGDNEIKTLASNCFFSLRHLTYFSIVKNNITSLNTTLVAMSELKHLDMSLNNINKLTGIDMIRLVSLTYLNMSHNAIESVEYNCFNQAISLHTLDLSYNRIKTPVEKPMFNYNSNLTYLNLYHNNITILGDSIFNFTKLNYFNIEKNNITGDITNKTFDGLQSITFLNVSYQHITSLKNYSFSKMINLRHLDLSHNNIGIVEKSSFVNASALIVLNISHNFIKDLDFLKMFSSNLTDIYINDNIISFIPEHIFSNHSSLKTLDISTNVITTIEANALSLYNIQFLNLKNNNLSGTLVDGVFSPARVLKKLDLSHHNLKAINDSAFINLPLLENLDISDNNIQYIDSNNFIGVENLKFLNISHNNLTSLNINGTLGNLWSLDVSNNKITNIPKLTFVNSSNFLILDFANNNISDLVYPDFRSLRNIIKLNLSHNNISYFNNQFTNTLTNLFYLNLEFNHLKEINLTYFKNIKRVNISNNDITYLDESQFKNLDLLSVLDVSANMIKEIFPGTFQHLRNLKILILSENNITNLRFGSFRGLNSTDLIDLSRNKINTINVDIFHECYKLKKVIIDYNNITSIDIERFVDVTPSLELISLGGNPIACEEIVKSSNKKFNEKTVQITSMHKVYHEDNVHGIRCGKNYNNNNVSEVTTEVITTPMPEKSEFDKGVSNSVVLVTWCSVISVLLIVGLGYIYRRHRNYTMNIDTGMRYQNTTTRCSINSESFNDLLS